MNAGKNPDSYCGVVIYQCSDCDNRGTGLIEQDCPLIIRETEEEQKEGVKKASERDPSGICLIPAEVVFLKTDEEIRASWRRLKALKGKSITSFG